MAGILNHRVNVYQYQQKGLKRVCSYKAIFKIAEISTNYRWNSKTTYNRQAENNYKSTIWNCSMNQIAPVEASWKSMSKHIFENVDIPIPYRWNSGKRILANQKTAVNQIKVLIVACIR